MARLSFGQVLKRAFDESKDAFNMVVVPGTAKNTISKLNGQQTMMRMSLQDKDNIRIVRVG